MIINQAIEQTILIDNRQDAVNTMSDTRLQNVKQCFAPNVRPGTGIRFSYGWGGGLSENYVPAFNGPPRMKTDVEFQIKSEQLDPSLFLSWLIICEVRAALNSNVFDLSSTILKVH